MSINFMNLFPKHQSWEQCLDSIRDMNPLPRHELEGFLDFITEKSKERFPDPQIIAGAILILEKSRFTNDDISDPQHRDALEVLVRTYSSHRLNPAHM